MLELRGAVKPSPQRAATDAIVAFVRSGNAPIAAYFKGKKVMLERNCMSCEMAGERAPKPKRMTGKQALAWIIAGQLAVKA